MAEEQPSDDKLKEYRARFEPYDKAGDNVVSVDDVRVIFSELKQRPTEKDMKIMLAEMTTEECGYVCFEEFVDMMTVHQAEVERIWRKTFTSFDKDGNGYITPDELDSVFKGLGCKLTDDQLEEEFNAVDSNQDGKISYEEFQKMMENRSA